MDDTTLIKALIRSYGYQEKIYAELTLLVQKILGKVTISRGDLNSAMDLFNQKQELLDKIEKERELISNEVLIWQERKSDLSEHENFPELEQVLVKIESTLSGFMKIEDQLRLFMEPQASGVKS